MQINLVKDFSFFDINKLDGFTKEVRKILSKNPFMSNERINKIIDQINKRISYVNELKNK